jgi:hypothetical protein
MTSVLFIVLLAIAAVTPGQRAMQNPPVAPTPAGMAYYLMRGNQIIGPPYADPQSCAKALAKLKNSLQPGSNMVVCAHRLP